MSLAVINQEPHDDAGWVTMWARAIRLFLSAEKPAEHDYDRYRKAFFELNNDEDETFIVTIYLHNSGEETVPENIRSIWVDYPNRDCEYKLYDNDTQKDLLHGMMHVTPFAAGEVMNEVVEFIEDYL